MYSNKYLYQSTLLENKGEKSTHKNVGNHNFPEIIVYITVGEEKAQ
jgi:hypothetical protein